MRASMFSSSKNMKPIIWDQTHAELYFYFYCRDKLPVIHLSLMFISREEGFNQKKMNYSEILTKKQSSVSISEASLRD